jgi:hypothetical protein
MLLLGGWWLVVGGWWFLLVVGCWLLVVGGSGSGRKAIQPLSAAFRATPVARTMARRRSCSSFPFAESARITPGAVRADPTRTALMVCFCCLVLFDSTSVNGRGAHAFIFCCACM